MTPSSPSQYSIWGIPFCSLVCTRAGPDKQESAPPPHACIQGEKKKVSVLSCCGGRRRNWRQRSGRASWSNYLLFPPLAFPLDNLLLFCSAANDTKTDFRKREGGWSVLMIFQVSADPCYYSPFLPPFFGGGRLNGGKAGAYFGTQLVKAEHQSPPPQMEEWGAFPVPPWRQNCPFFSSSSSLSPKMSLHEDPSSPFDGHLQCEANRRQDD